MDPPKKVAIETMKLKIKYLLGWSIVCCSLYVLFLIVLVAVFYGFFPNPSVDSFVAFLVLGAGGLFFMYFVGLYCYEAYQKEKRSLVEELTESNQGSSTSSSTSQGSDRN